MIAACALILIATAADSDEAVTYHVVLKNGTEFYGIEVDRNDKFIDYELNMAGQEGERKRVRLEERESFKSETRRDTTERLREEYLAMGLETVTGPNGETLHPPVEEVERAERALELMAEAEARRTQEAAQLAQRMSDTAAAPPREDGAPQGASTWGLRLVQGVIVLVALALAGILVKTMVLD